jgi:hypothetical protein
VVAADRNWAGTPDLIELDLVEAADRVGIEVRDRAPPASRLALMSDPNGEIDLDDRQLGLALVGALVDDLRIAALEGGGSRTSFWLRRGPELLPPPLT